MKRIGWMAVAAILVCVLGCGGSSGSKKTASKKSTAKTQRTSAEEPTPPPPPPPKPKIVVPQNAYSSVPQAMQLYTAALMGQNADDADAVKEQKATEVSRVEAWLEMNKDTAIPALGEVLKNPSSSLESQIAASRALGRCGPTAAQTLIDAIGVVKAEQVRIKSIESLSLLKPANPDSIKTLHGLMSHSDSKIRQNAIQGLARIGKPAKDVVPDLQLVLNNPKENDTVRSAAKDALKKIDPRKGFIGMKLD